jgi:hypothetical protein
MANAGLIPLTGLYLALALLVAIAVAALADPLIATSGGISLQTFDFGDGIDCHDLFGDRHDCNNVSGNALMEKLSIRCLLLALTMSAY